MQIEIYGQKEKQEDEDILPQRERYFQWREEAMAEKHRDKKYQS